MVQHLQTVHQASNINNFDMSSQNIHNHTVDFELPVLNKAYFLAPPLITLSDMTLSY